MSAFYDTGGGIFGGPGFLNRGKGLQYFQPQNTWTPKKLFAAGEAGAWYDPSDLSTLFMDAAGTIPVVADGDPVGLMMDKSGNGNHAWQNTSAWRPTYHTDGVRGWIAGDGIDDFLIVSSNAINPALSATLIFAVLLSSPGNYPTIWGSNPSSWSINVLMDTTILKPRLIVRTPATIFASAINAIALNQEYIFTTKWNRASGVAGLYQNKTLAVTLTNTGGDLTTVSSHEIFRTWLASTCWPGNFYGGIVVDALIDTTKADAYLAKKAGVTL